VGPLSKSDLLTVETALARLTGRISPLGSEMVSLGAASGRVLAGDLVARRTQPPVAMSAMDGYAVRAADVARVPATLGRVGVSAAGCGFAGAVGSGQAVRIFTGAPIPDGADTIVIQEDTDSDGDIVTVRKGAPVGRHIRVAGIDFAEGDILLRAGCTLGPQDIALAAAMNHPWLPVRRAPRVAILATGDELVLPGEPLGPDQIICSNAFGVAAMVRAWGGDAVDLGIARDEREALRRAAAGAHGADILVTIGGISVGDHDLVRAALGKEGLDVDFWRIAMRPGKPLMFGRLGESWVLGLPGNPVSALVCALVFLRPAIDCLLGRDIQGSGQSQAVLGGALPENDGRQDYLRAGLRRSADGTLVATPFKLQDSSVLSLLSRADCLVVRPPRAPAAPMGVVVPVLPLPGRAASRI
jgi:molybdopterin molybdotransferase